MYGIFHLGIELLVIYYRRHFLVNNPHEAELLHSECVLAKLVQVIAPIRSILDGYCGGENIFEHVTSKTYYEQFFWHSGNNVAGI